MANPFAKAWWNAQDAFKANTDRDKKKRQEAGQPILYQDQQRMAPVQRPVQVNRPTFKPFDNSLTRGLSRGFDQVNMFDNNRTWQQTAPTNQRSVIGQIGGAPRAFYRSTKLPRQGLNLAVGAIGSGVELGNMGKESIFGTDQSYQRAVNEGNRRLDNYLMGPGAFGDGVPVSFQGERAATSFIDDPQKIKDTAAIGADIASYVPVAKGFQIGMGTVKQIPKVVAQNAIEGTLTGGASSATRQMAQNGKIDPMQLLKETVLSGTASGVSPVVGRGFSKGVKAGSKQIQEVAEKAGSNAKIFTKLNQGGYIQLPGGRREVVTGKASEFPDLKGQVKAGKITNDVEIVPRDSLQRGSDTLGTKLDQKRIQYYQNKIRTDEKIQPIVVSADGKFIADGAHRNAAFAREGITDVPIVREIKKRPVQGVARQSQLAKQVSEPFDDITESALERSRVKQYFDKKPEVKGSALSGEGAQLPAKAGEVVTSVDPVTKKITSRRLFKPMDEVGGAQIGDIPGLNKVAKKQSKFAQTMSKSDEISPELQSSVKKANPEYIPLENAEMAKVSKKFVNKGYKKASVEVTSRLETKLGKINGQDVADTIHVIKELDKRGGIENLQKATDLSEKLSQHLTKAGQTIQASSILNNRTPAGMMYGARKFLKKNGVEVTPEIQKQIKSKVDEIAKLPKGEDRLYKIAELQQSISQLVPSTGLEKAVGLWKAGLLTGIKTQTGNTLSGVATNVIKTASDAPAALLDTGFSALGKTKVGKKLGFQGQRSKVFTLRGKGEGAVEGAKKGWKSLKTGIDERNMEASKFDTKRLVFSNKPAGKIAQKYTDTVYGLMGAADRPNYYANLRNNLYDLAIVDAKNKNLTGALKETHIKKFIKEPPMSALETANKAAETAIFANDTALSKIAGGVIKKAEEAGPAVGTVAKIAMPFTKVPSSVATRLIDYSPFGAVKTVVGQIQNVKKGGVLDQRALSEGLAQSGVGTGTMFLGMKLKEADLMTGSYPTDEKERELWKLEGKQPNSIKVGGKWLSFNYTSPVGQILAIGGKVQEAKESGQGLGGQLATGAAAIPKTVSEQSFLQGVSGIQDAINDPERSGAKFAKSQAASIIPTLSNDIGKATDKYQRQSNSIPEAIKARIPGLNQTLLPKQDSFGAPLPRASGPVDTLLNPFRPSKVRETNPLNSELRRLQDAQFGVMPSTTDKKLIFGSKAKGTEQIVNLTPEQLYDKNNQTGQQIQKIWNDIIKSPEYQKMDDSEKQKTLRNALSDVNAVTRNQFAAKNKPELLDLQKLSKDQTKLAQGNTPDYSSKTMKSSSKSDSGSDTDTYEYRKTSSQNSLDMSRATNNNNLDMYLKSANNELEALEKLKKQYDPKTEQDKINNITKKQEALFNKAKKYANQGYIKKGKKTSTKKGRKGKKGGSYSAKSLLIGNTSGTRSLLRNAKVTYKKRKK